MCKNNGESRQNTCQTQLVKTDFALLISLLSKKIKALSHRVVLNKCFIMALIISTVGNTSFSGQRQSAEGWTGLRGKPRLMEQAEAELAQVVWCLVQPFQELALAPQTMSPISSHKKSFETNVSDQRSRIWSLTQFFKVFKPFKTPVGV